MRAIAIACGTAMIATAATAQIPRENLVIWDYREHGATTLSAYHHWLVGYCQSHPPKRLVLYVTDPTQDAQFCPFYDPTAAPDTTATSMNLAGFITCLHDLNTQPPIEVEMMIDRESFHATAPVGTCGGWTRAAGDASVGSITPPALAADWVGLPYAMEWYKDLLANTAVVQAGLVKGITLDPEFHAPQGQLSGERAYLASMIWMDMFFVANQITDQRVGITVGVDAHTFAKVLVSDYPFYTESEYPSASPLDISHVFWKCKEGCSTPDSSLCQYACDLYTYIQSNGGAAPSGELNYRPGTTDPLVDSVYMQVYYGCDMQTSPIGLGYWQWMCKDGCSSTTPSPRDAIAPWTTVPQTSANLLAGGLLREPNLPGPANALVTATANATLKDPDDCAGPAGGAVLVGTNTDFRLWPDQGRVQLVGPNGPVPGSEWKIFYPWSSPLPPEACGELWPQTDETHISVCGPRVSEQTPLPYKITELVMFYPVPGVTDAMASRFWFMFSAEKDENLPMFGYWNWADFNTFLSEFDTLATGSKMPFADIQTPQQPIPFPSQYAIYDLKHACTNWGTDFWSGPVHPASDLVPECAGDFDGSGAVDGGDLGALLAAWDSVDLTIDLTGDHMVGGADLGMLLSLWGPCPK